jgi:predicted ATPase/DNA-binding SARP family transcriptional activator
MHEAASVTHDARRGRGRVRVAVLGPIVAQAADGRAIEVTGATARALLASLALGGGSGRGVDALTDAIWGDEPPKNPRAALQTIVSRVRSVLGADVVRSTPGGYALGDVDTDLAEAERLIASAGDVLARGDDPLPLLDEATAVWSGEPGADVQPAPVAEELRDAAASLRARLDDRRVQGLRATGRHGEAARLLGALADAHPYDESVHEQLMRALADAGRTGEALEAFARLRARLREDLGSDPGQALTGLNAALLKAQSTALRPRVRIGVRAAPNELYGRAGDLAAVGSLLQRARVTTLLGTGGLGKTRLAQAVAAGSDVPAVVVVPLAGVRADDDVAPAVATALGISEASPGGSLADMRMRPDLRARMAGLLGEQATLLVLDNCEQVIDGVAAWVADMLAAVPSLRVLTTSRAPLAIAGEAVYPLAPLAAQGADSPAVLLFLERARAVRPAASLRPEVVTRLCSHLDGLPLAIELAAARVRTMTPEQIEQRLQDRFALLTSGDRAAPERHRTLEAVIGWSWDLLDAAAQRAMATLSVLPAGFSAETASAVLGADVDDVLDRLVSQSLLLVVEEPSTVRFRMLETIREYALVRLADEPDGVDDAWDAVTVWARGFADSHLGHAFERASHADVRAEHDNLIAALRRAIDRGDHPTAVEVFALLGLSWMVRGALTEMTSFVGTALDAAGQVREGDVTADALAVVLLVGAFMAQFGPQFGGDLRAARFIARLRLLRRHRPQMTPVVGALAEALTATVSTWTNGDVEPVLDVLDTLREAPEPATRLVGESLLSQLAENDGRIDRALEAALRIEGLAAQTGAEWFAAMAAATVAQLASQSGQAHLALEWIDRADAGYGSFGAVDQQRQLTWLRAMNVMTVGEPALARTIFAEMAGTSERDEDGQESAAIGVYGLAEIARGQGDRQTAAAQFERALAKFGSARLRGSPWFLIAMGGALSAMVFDGLTTAENRAQWARRLRGRTLAMVRMRRGATDRPVLGTVLAAWSSWAMHDAGLVERGVEALVLGELLGARQDLPSMRHGEHDARATALVGVQRIAAARAAASTLDRRALLTQALAVLGDPVTR